MYVHHNSISSSKQTGSTRALVNFFFLRICLGTGWMLWEDNYWSNGISAACTGEAFYRILIFLIINMHDTWVLITHAIYYSRFWAQLLLVILFMSGNGSRRHHRDCREWNYWIIAFSWKRRGHSPCQEYRKTCHSCREEAYNGKERIWKGQGDVFRTSHGTQNCFGAERSFTEVKEPPSFLTLRRSVLPAVCWSMIRAAFLGCSIKIFTKRRTSLMIGNC